MTADCRLQCRATEEHWVNPRRHTQQTATVTTLSNRYPNANIITSLPVNMKVFCLYWQSPSG